MNNQVEKLARQGDILFLRIEALPTGLKKAGDNIIAHGEVTGHSHRVVEDAGVAVLEDSNGEKYVTATQDWEVVHDEHGPIKFAKGIYKARRQREYEPEGIRQVAD
jgi:hypothetical protein